MKMRFQNTLPFAAALSLSSAHTIFTQLEVEGTTYPISYGIRDPTYDGPITDVTTNYIACNGGPNPTMSSPNIINVKAGGTVIATWRHTLTSTASNDATYVIDPSHKGPIMAYLKKVTDATTDPGYGGGWFKIQQAGLNVSTQDWAVTDLIANGGYHSITIPTCIVNGQYLLRAELLALHSAGSLQGAQFYMECAQLNITGGTGAVTPSAVSLPGAYASTDPGILINIYQTLTTYVIPGPTVFSCNGGNPPPTFNPPPPPSSTPRPSTTSVPTTFATSSKPTTAVTTSKPPTTSTSSTKAPSSTSTGGSPLYGQCGGMNWAGPTTCASGTCKYSNPYYSQCLP